MVLVDRNPIRILHIVGRMNQGGIETWLMHVLRNIDRNRFQMDFLVHTTQTCAYDEEIRTLGSQIIPCLNPSRPWLYARNFQRILSEYGPYDIVHSHVHHYSGYVLRLAEKAGVRVRIAHCHNDSSPVTAHASWQRRIYLNLMKDLIKRHATLGLGCSQPAIIDLFGSGWKKDSRCQLLYYGIDMLPFRESINALEVRAELNIPASAFVIGHVGRFHKQKNHQFLLEIFAEIVNREPQAYLLLLGQGSLQPNIEQQALQIGLRDQVIFAGTRSDIPRVMRGAIDVFLFPSLHEGLPLVLLEAQSAGLPCIFSDVITDEVNVIEPLLTKMPLSQSASHWAEAVLKIQHKLTVPSQVNPYELLEKSNFNIEVSVRRLTSVYEAK